MKGVYGAITQAIHKKNKQELRTLAVEELGDNDRFTVLSVTSRSQSSRVVDCSLWWRWNRCPRAEFIAWARYHLTLPPLLFDRAPQACIVEVAPLAPCPMCAFSCKRDSSGQIPFLDPWGNHAVACLSANSTRHHCHSQLQSAAKHMAKVTTTEYKHEHGCLMIPAQRCSLTLQASTRPRPPGSPPTVIGSKQSLKLKRWQPAMTHPMR